MSLSPVNALSPSVSGGDDDDSAVEDAGVGEGRSDAGHAVESVADDVHAEKEDATAFNVDVSDDEKVVVHPRVSDSTADVERQTSSLSDVVDDLSGETDVDLSET